MVGEANSISENGVVLTIIFWSYMLGRAAAVSPRLERLLRPSPIALVRNWCMLRANVRRESVTRDELMTQLREAGIEDLAVVKIARLEGDGHISIIRADGSSPEPKVRKADPGAA